MAHAAIQLFAPIIEVLQDFHRPFGSRNSPTTGIPHTICHVYRSVWPAREAEPNSGATLVYVKLAYTYTCSSIPLGITQFIDIIDVDRTTLCKIVTRSRLCVQLPPFFSLQ